MNDVIPQKTAKQAAAKQVSANQVAVKQRVIALVFQDFETLDLFGVVEMFGRLGEVYQMHFVFMDGGLVSNGHGVVLQTKSIAEMSVGDGNDVLLVVGGMGTRALVHDGQFLDMLRRLSESAQWVLSVCTGSALLAKAGILDARQATSNKRAWQWVVAQSDNVTWVQQARWVVDGKFYTSSGVSAGMDMALGFIADRHGIETARQAAKEVEYVWQEDDTTDDFWDAFI